MTMDSIVEAGDASLSAPHQSNGRSTAQVQSGPLRLDEVSSIRAGLTLFLRFQDRPLCYKSRPYSAPQTFRLSSFSFLLLSRPSASAPPPHTRPLRN